MTIEDTQFEVIALQGPGRSWRSVGRFRDLETAVRARVEDTLRQLEANDGWLVRAEHLVIGPGTDGPATVRCCMSEVGSDLASDRVPLPFNLPATRAWLLASHELA